MIHYHGVKLSGGRQTQLALTRRHAFVSFADPTRMAVCAEICQSVAVDNGAYTAWTEGTPYDVEKYAEFVATWYRHPAFDFYLIPDAIEGGVTENTRLRSVWGRACQGTPGLWDLGVPVWHLHEPLELLRDLANAYGRIALGSSGAYAQVGTPEWWGRMGEAMKVVTDDEGRPVTKLHGLRMLDPTIFSWLPFASADSTHVARTIAFDEQWNRGWYEPKSKEMRAAILMERIELHASATRWTGVGWGGSNNELFG
tara:strand:+ start:103 stop:867 length:765 start_codon:yes stop_codon:yes gene_type:complete